MIEIYQKKRTRKVKLEKSCTSKKKKTIPSVKTRITSIYLFIYKYKYISVEHEKKKIFFLNVTPSREARIDRKDCIYFARALSLHICVRMRERYGRRRKKERELKNTRDELISN